MTKNTQILAKIGEGCALAAISLLSTSPALSLSTTFNLTFTATGVSGSSGTGQITVDNSLLAPNTFTFDLADLQAFNATFINIPGGGATTTTFNLTDLGGWVFATDGSGNIVDINFISNNFNGDGYALVDNAPFSIDLDTATVQGLENYTITLQPDAVPFEFSPGLGILILMGLGGTKAAYKHFKAQKDIKDLSV